MATIARAIQLIDDLRNSMVDAAQLEDICNICGRLDHRHSQRNLSFRQTVFRHGYSSSIGKAQGGEKSPIWFKFDQSVAVTVTGLEWPQSP
jgi:hypothetical protein